MRLHVYVPALLLLLIPALAYAQLSLQFPTSRFVTQRDLTNTGRLFIAGQMPDAADVIEAQLTPAAPGQGTATNWQPIPYTPGTTFVGSLTGVGGWYVLTVRAMRNGSQVASATVDRVGIGEVFITAGQSNSRGLGPYDNDLGAVTDRVSSIDAIRYNLPPGSPVIFSPDTPMPYATYSPLTAQKRIFPMGESSWGWGELGDYIVHRYNVPVMFYDAGWDASTVDNWNRTGHGLPACNRYYCVADWPYLQPYSNLKNILRYYAATGGVRAVLWHQGESEWGDQTSGSVPLYANRLDSLIRRTRQDFNGQPVPWVLARVSFDGQNTNANVVAKQQQVIRTPDFQVFEGPLNDTIQNRLGGNIDVHFGNAVRLSPHPQYYRNTSGIPAGMGLSRFARNWNNSLTDNFFRSAQPVLPAQFAATGDVVHARGSGAFAPGDSVAVAFVTTGTFNAGNQWQVQVLDQQGRHRATLGSGARSPVRVRWPDSLGVGTYRVRVLSSSPVVAAAPTPELILRPAADLQLRAVARRRVLLTGDTTTVWFTVENAGSTAAPGVVLHSRLPPNVEAVGLSGGVSVQNNVVVGSVGNLSAGESQMLPVRLRLTANGRYEVAAELMRANAPDPDSWPASGTADGQDDAVLLDLRTVKAGDTYRSPNPNQAALPAVRSNQPTPVPNQADLSLHLVVNSRTPRINELVTYTLVVANQGGAAASNVGVVVYLPTSLDFMYSNQLTLSNGTLTGQVASIPANESVRVPFTVRPTASGTWLTRAQLTAATPADPDSAPNNATSTSRGEDDEVQLDVRVK